MATQSIVPAFSEGTILPYVARPETLTTGCIPSEPNKCVICGKTFVVGDDVGFTASSLGEGKQFFHARCFARVPQPLTPTCAPVCAHGLCRICGRKLVDVCEDCQDHRCDECNSPLAPADRRYVKFPWVDSGESPREIHETRLCCCPKCLPKLQTEADTERNRLEDKP